MELQLNTCEYCGALYIGDFCHSCGHRDTLIFPLSSADSAAIIRHSLGSEALDLLFGGGVVQPSSVLISGPPGCGKSTLLLQIASLFSKCMKVLYFSLEEPCGSIRNRALRLGLDMDSILVCTSSEISDIENQILSSKVDLIIVDSLQMVEACGRGRYSISASKYAIDTLVRISEHKILFVVSQMTKSGEISGSRAVEHKVDVVIHLQKNSKDTRVMSTSKNRFGAAEQRCLLKITDKGLIPI